MQTRKLFFHMLMAAVFGLPALLESGDGWAATVDAGQARQAAVAYAARHQVSAVAATGRRQLAASPAAGAETPPGELLSDAGMIGFVVTQEPAGFIVVRADDELPPVKLQVDTGAYEDLPAGFRAVIEDELAGELADLEALRQAGVAPPAQFHAAWQALTTTPPATATAAAGTVLLTTEWDQGAPYNDYAPEAPGGPDGRAYAGCGPCALAQILRFHQWPAAPLTDYTYWDRDGVCTGMHTLSAVGGLAAYDWDNMPASVANSSAQVQRQAVGRLLYQCGVAMAADFEADGTSVYSDPDTARALRDIFGYTCDDITSQWRWPDAAWYAKIQADIDAGHPIYYTMRTFADEGHAVVCDGYRNGSEIHLNFGWSGAGNAWYDLNSVVYDGDTWSEHEAVFAITPAAGGKNRQTLTFPALPDPTYGDADFAPGATASSGLAVAYASDNPAVATVVDGGIRVAGAGTATITASQPGNDNWRAAAAVSQSLTVAKKTLTVTADNQTCSIGAATPALSLSYAGWVNQDTDAALDAPPTAKCSATATSKAGSYAITASGGSDANYAFSYVAGTLTVTAIPPTVTTAAPVAITSTSARGGGNATDAGGATVTARGVCWSATGTPTANDAKIVTGTGIGTFTGTFSGLIPNTAYCVRAYATNSAGTGYGEPLAFATPAFSGPDFVVTSLVLSPALPAVGGKVMAAITVRNQGTATGKAGTLYVWLDKPAAAVAGETGDKSASVGTLKPGQVKTVRLALTAPKTRGAFTLRALVDAKQITAEAREDNNQASHDYHTGLPNFEILNVRLSPEPPAAGKTFTAYVTVANSGEVTGKAGYLDLWADRSSLAAAPVAGGMTKGNRSKSVGVLPPGQKKIITVTGLTAPTANPAPVLSVLIDSRAKTAEINESDNRLDFHYNCK